MKALIVLCFLYVLISTPDILPLGTLHPLISKYIDIFYSTRLLKIYFRA